jgi:GR25 family glycosyltransferase involved in LPS biosynthesis
MGVLGCWLSHTTLMKEMVMRQSRNSTSSGARFLLVLEDDIRIDPHFFTRLPELLDMLPTGGRPWSMVRFSTLGCADEDAVPGHPHVYYTRNHPGWKDYPKLASRRNELYVGSHAVLLQLPTVAGLLSRILAHPKGVIGIDMA